VLIWTPAVISCFGSMAKQEWKPCHLAVIHGF
jgi:hypothetical protein